MENYYELPVWEHPSDYGGFSPDGDYLIYARNRDSTILENSNYDLILAELEELAAQFEDDDSEPYAYDFRAGHWAVGWVEYILIRKESPDALQALACEILGALADYPVYSESDYSQRQWDEMCAYWERCPLSEKIEWAKDSGASIFSVRHSMPEAFEQSEMFY